MKYISVVLVLLAMGWTWSMATTERPFSLEQHRGIETELETMIAGIIKHANSDAGEVVIRKLYTEMVKPGAELLAHYRYSFDTPVGGDDAEQTYHGTALLKSDDGGKTWTVAANDAAPSLVFKKGMQVSPNSEVETEAQEPASPASKDSH